MKLKTTGIEDPFVLQNFDRLNIFFSEENIITSKFKHFEITFTGAVTNQKFPHNLGFLPKDVILTYKVGAGNITFNYDLFDRTNIDVTTTGACVVRLFLGTYKDEAL